MLVKVATPMFYDTICTTNNHYVNDTKLNNYTIHGMHYICIKHYYHLH